MKHVINKRKQEFYDIFAKQSKEELDSITCKGKLTYDDLIDNHFSCWTMCRIDGISASMSFDYCVIEAVQLLDEIAKEYFNPNRV